MDGCVVSGWTAQLLLGRVEVGKLKSSCLFICWTMGPAPREGTFIEFSPRCPVVLDNTAHGIFTLHFHRCDFSAYQPLSRTVPFSGYHFSWSGGTSLFSRKWKADLASEKVGKAYWQGIWKPKRIFILGQGICMGYLWIPSRDSVTFFLALPRYILFNNSLWVLHLEKKHWKSKTPKNMEISFWLQKSFMGVWCWIMDGLLDFPRAHDSHCDIDLFPLGYTNSMYFLWKSWGRHLISLPFRKADFR